MQDLSKRVVVKVWIDGYEIFNTNEGVIRTDSDLKLKNYFTFMEGVKSKELDLKINLDLPDRVLRDSYFRYKEREFRELVNQVENEVMESKNTDEFIHEEASEIMERLLKYAGLEFETRSEAGQEKEE